MSRFLPYSRQQIDEDDIAAVAACLRGDLLTSGPLVAAFEEALREKTDAEFIVACSNGTAALHLASLALGLGPGDQVVVPTLTFLATANGPHFTGSEIVFADVDPDTGLLTTDTLAEALGRAPRARAVFPVHLNGAMAPMAGLRTTAEAQGLAIVEDACHALGSTYLADGKERKAGECRHSDIAAFSFHPVKVIAMGEGGAVATNNRGLADRARLFRNHGMTRTPDQFLSDDLARDRNGQINPWYYEMPELGFNYRVPDILCALGVSQLKKLERFIGRRRYLAETYDRALAGFAPLIRPIARPADCQSAFHLYVVQIDFDQIGRTRAEVMNALRAEGVGTQVHYLPVHLQPYYRNKQPGLRLSGAEAYYRRAMSLPLFPGMTDDDVAQVVDALARATGLAAPRPYARVIG